MQNLKYIYENGAEIVLRCPIIPTQNDTEEHFSFLRGLRETYPRILEMEVMPYHNMGIGKAKRLGMEIRLELDNPSREQINKWKMLCQTGDKK